MAFDRWVAPRCGLEYYQADFLSDELGVLLHRRRHHDAIYHYLYGEDQFWLLGKVKRGRGKLVASYHQPPRLLAGTVRRTEHVRRLDAVVILADNQRAFFEPLVGTAAVHRVPHGVDVDFFRPPPQRRPPSRVRRCLFAGSWLRDFETLRRVASRLQSDHGSAVEITVVTGAPNHAYLTGCENVRLSSGIDEAELLRLYQTCDLAILPMLDSTANNVLLESMACGMPAVVTDVGGTRDYADDSCAVLVPPGDADAMADAVSALLEDTGRRLRMGEAARNVAERFDWREVARRMTTVYATL